jgi:carbon storage regulator CsrA
MALCLTRRPGQKLILDRPRIEITVESVVGKTVRLVIDAPKHVKIIREELIYRAPPKTEEAAS